MRSLHWPLRAITVLWVVSAACGGTTNRKNDRYPPRPEGCPVELFQAGPRGATDNIGPVSATCSEQTKDDDCIRTLKDEVCRMGGDVVWGVDAVPEKRPADRKRFTGRAAHTVTHPDEADGGLP